jgi:hypothetical protein
VSYLNMPLTPMRVWEAITRRRGEGMIPPSSTTRARVARGGLQRARVAEDAKLLAGGHSLIPLMKLRLAAPTLLVDLRTVPGLRGVREERASGGSAR